MIKGPTENPTNLPEQRKELDPTAAREALKAKIAAQQPNTERPLSPEQQRRLDEAVNAYADILDGTRDQLSGLTQKSDLPEDERRLERKNAA